MSVACELVSRDSATPCNLAPSAIVASSRAPTRFAFAMRVCGRSDYFWLRSKPKAARENISVGRCKKCPSARAANNFFRREQRRFIRGPGACSSGAAFAGRRNAKRAAASSRCCRVQRTGGGAPRVPEAPMIAPQLSAGANCRGAAANLCQRQRRREKHRGVAGALAESRCNPISLPRCAASSRRPAKLLTSAIGLAPATPRKKPKSCPKNWPVRFNSATAASARFALRSPLVFSSRLSFSRVLQSRSVISHST